MTEQPERLAEALTHGLQPAPAPHELWDRVEAALEPRPRRILQPRRLVFAVAAASLAIVVAIAVFAQRPGASLATLAAAHRELIADSRRLQVLTCDQGKLSAWLDGHGFAIAPVVSSQTGITLVGAGVLQREGHAYAVLHYRVEGAPATLFVRPSEGSTRRPKTVLESNSPGLTMYRWRDRGQEFVLIVSATHEARRACGLCHGEAAG